MLMDTCVFCKLVSGELPNHTVYEDDHLLAFMDIAPITKGHVVVIPKKHEAQLWDLEVRLYSHVMMTGQKVVLKIRQILNPFRVGLIVESMEVEHAHLKLFPINEGMKQTLNDQVMTEPDHEKLAILAKQLHL